MRSIKGWCLLVILLAGNFLLSAAIPAVERQALIDLYNSTAGDSWTNNSGWKTPPLDIDGFAMPGTEGTWDGITVTADHVRYIDMYNNNLTGTIPANLGSLSNLQQLILDSNKLSGTIPAELGSLGNLINLGLNNNQLTGIIPTELGSLNKLQYLVLTSNGLTGTIPIQLGNLSSLISIYLNSNQLTGIIPTQLGNLGNLQNLALGSNQLSGTIPAELGSLSNLEVLALGSNRLSGTIPTQLGSLNKLYYFSIGSNQLSGSIPTSLTNLTLLDSSWTDIGYNALYTSNAGLITFLNSKDYDWAMTQTVAPANVAAMPMNSSTINLTWDAISYNGEAGGYRIFVGTTSGGPYTFFQQTTDKTATSCSVTGLNSGIPYYFVIKTRTDANDFNQNIVDSEYSLEVTATTVSEETITAPSRPGGPASGVISASYDFSTGGSTSSLGHSLQYFFDWDDGSTSGWLAEGTTQASHSWAANGTYDVRAMARCVTHTTIESLWSATHAIIISDSGTLGKYNSPAQQKILPEVIWAAATGGGTWMSEVQVTDISGGSQVSVYYSTSAGRRGPFVLWNNGGGALRSQKYSNMLQTIDGLDSGVFTYYGTVGAVEFVTQDAAHVLQVMARTLNGSYSKTFPGLSLHDANTADTSRVMIVANLTNNSTYRSTCGMFNPTADALTVELRLRNAANGQIGSLISKTLGAYGFSAFLPFNDAGVAYPANSYDNVILEIQPTSGTGKVLCFGASANNATNDPAAHLAMQNGSGYDNGPGWWQILPEAIWAPATGGGTWMSETQIVDVSGGSTVNAFFFYGGDNRRGPFTLWTGSVAGSKVKYANILQQLETIDSGFAYYGHVGTIKFYTQDGSHPIQVTTRTLNGNYSKTFPGLNQVDAEMANTSRMMLIQNFTNNNAYRSTCGFFNPYLDTVIVEFTLLNGSGVQIGAPFSKTFVGYDYQAFSPFNEAGVPYPANSFDNVILRVRPTSGTGEVVCFGASANNASNDPAAHLAVQGQ